MNQTKFISTWAKTRKKGIGIYIVKCTLLILLASVLGKEIGDYLSKRIIFKAFGVYDYIGLVFIVFISILLGSFLWKHNETQWFNKN